MKHICSTNAILHFRKYKLQRGIYSRVAFVDHEKLQNSNMLLIKAKTIKEPRQLHRFIPQPDGSSLMLYKTSLPAEPPDKKYDIGKIYAFYKLKYIYILNFCFHMAF